MPLPEPNQTKLPLLEGLREYASNPHVAFYTPGHKRGVGISPSLADLLGETVFRADLAELPGLGNLHGAEGIIQEAQDLAAETFGADRTYFLVNGSSCGVMAAILATCNAGEKIILPRNVHSSAIAGLIFSGAIPVFVNPDYDPILDLAHCITPAAVAAALEKHPDTKAVMMVYPTYYGVCGDVGAIANLAHQRGIPLLIDEAHGPHFAFHPDLPASALSAGADLSVQSIHKVLGSLTQSAMLHLQGSRIDRDRLGLALRLVESTSPSYLLLASLDAARQQMALHGERLMTKTLELADAARSQIDRIPGLSVLTHIKSGFKIFESSPHPQPLSQAWERGAGGGVRANSGFVDLDRTRLTVRVAELGLTGFEADEIMTQQGVVAELPSLQHLTFIVSLGNTKTDIDLLAHTFSIIHNYSKPKYRLQEIDKEKVINLFDCESINRISPREAFFSPAEMLPIDEAIDRLSAELICPYPPGIPVVMPGEVITQEAIDYLQKILAFGGIITGCSDPSLQKLKVVRK
ncbi:MAG: aminotransferase class I/II-fold pyridoxal phosphate-dependent enzyme [Cyanosarcina radialis HA8281-LM2]|nr:aminotransferase class I/II-fold pyridoxal phosphate-dependent enzyme [Cyanosarcina radialis HA8281-LM2]